MKPIQDAREIFLKGVERVDPERLLDFALALEGETLRVKHAQGDFEYCLTEYDHIVVAGMGKASAVLAKGVEKLLGARVEDGFVVTKALGQITCRNIRLSEAGHPVPDERSVAAGEAMLSLAAKVRGFEDAGQKTLVLVLISGGGSALLAAPAFGISLEDKAQATRLLLGSGATIQEVNAVRKHLSAVKGGRLAQAFAPATVLSLILSDVIGDDLDAIASGPTVPDSSTWESAYRVLVDRKVWNSLPPSVRHVFEDGLAGRLPDTLKQDSGALATVRTVLVGNNMLALQAAESEARMKGYSTLLLSSRIVGEAREVAKMFLALASDVVQYGIPVSRPACILSGGETTVTLKGSGLGGRNQEMALAVLSGLDPRLPGHGELVFLSAGTDGNDGPTDAAGAFASFGLAKVASERGLDPLLALADNDSYSFFNAIDGLLKTGPTGTNVCDMQVLILPAKDTE